MKRKFEDAAKTFFKKYLTGGIKRYTFALRFGSETVSTLKEGKKGNGTWKLKRRKGSWSARDLAEKVG
ncbi:hypothetical protein HH214_01390 [Mucilaginibacter robiniae]|uniref:Uncharacterized protein n=1 Tax=Mucilaginibacter robiniae TaxID=2728022 RepID=A0A7L5DX02_9SPHI|nr:hypothetical protein [Mucilaginibacter robiniae]QJD94617.1 hypothetical protein HH214_01390 [Mucilaginibacter robiniae]